MLLRRFVLALYFLPALGKRGGSGGYGGQRASYPSSHGLSGTSYNRPSYQQNGGLSGQTYNRPAYPASGGLSGTNRLGSGAPGYHKTEVHHHYNYAPPQYISYGSGHHPVYRGAPPVYVYEYRNSGSRFDNLLTGLALYNLGRMSAHEDSYRQRGYSGQYRGRPGEVCKLAISRPNGEYEETRVDCRLMSSFIWDAEREPAAARTVSVTQTVVSNGTTTTNTTIVDALQVKGPSIQVSPGMDCFMIRIAGDTSRLRKRVDCALLQEYAVRSYNGCYRVELATALLWALCLTLLLL